MTTEIELAELDKQHVALAAEKAVGENGIFDPAEIDEYRRFRGWSTSYTYAAFSQAQRGEYEGNAESGRELLSSPGLKHARARRRGISVAQAAVELAGTDSAAGSKRIADLADELVEHEKASGREISYAEALVEVQRPGTRAGELPRRRAEGTGEDVEPNAVELAGFAGMGRTNYKPEAWVRATIVHLEEKYGDKIDTTKHLLPIRKPDGSLSLEAMKEAAKKLIVMDGIPQDKKREAARELIRAYRQVDDNPPDSLAALAGVTHPRGFAEEADEGDREDVRIADLADELVVFEASQGREMDYATAVIDVQQEGYAPPNSAEANEQRR